tara:strand:+ start:6617 stop:6799 length:183 start_codon:yes stop_codon:yes gene_type:complete
MIILLLAPMGKNDGPTDAPIDAPARALTGRLGWLVSKEPDLFLISGTILPSATVLAYESC